MLLCNSLQPYAGQQCVNGILTEAALSKIASVRSHCGEQRVFPGLNFACNTTVTKWMIGAQLRQISSTEETRHPQIQIWRRRSPQSVEYDLVYYCNITASGLVPSANLNVYEYSPSPPFGTLQDGDTLGLYQPELEHSEVVVFYRFDGGPVSYKQTVVPAVQPSQTFLGTETDNDLPLISVMETAVGMVTVQCCRAVCNSSLASLASFAHNAITFTFLPQRLKRREGVLMDLLTNRPWKLMP